MAIPGHEFLTAHFSNNDRTIVESYWTTPDGKETRVEYIEAKEGDPSWENLLTHMDIDTLHESTYKQIRAQNEAFENDVVKIGKERGLIYDLSEGSSNLYKMIAHAIFADFNEEEDKERLFLFKLELFELDAIKKSKSRNLKSNLRKSKNLLEAIKAAVAIAEESKKTTTPLDA